MIDRLKKSISMSIGQGYLSLAMAFILLFSGSSLLIKGVSGAGKPSTPPYVASTSVVGQISEGSSNSALGHERSEPISIQIPSQNIESDLIQVGNNTDGTIEVPKADKHDYPAWYKHSSTPGEIGSSVIVGHVDSTTGPSVFFELGNIQPGEKILIKREDGTTATFVAYKTALYPKNEFPTMSVYGPSDNAELRLVTCGGNFNKSINDYEGNTVVFAKLIE